MAKRKGRAARKQQREKAAKAQDHGLPAPELAPRPQKTRKVGGDTVAAAVASEKAGRAGPVRRAAPPPQTGLPVGAKVLIGAAVALLIVFGLSQLRKSESTSAPPRPEFVSTDEARAEVEPPSTADSSPLGDESTPAPERMEDRNVTDAVVEERREAPAPPPVPSSVPSSGVISSAAQAPAPSSPTPSVSDSAPERAKPSSVAPKSAAPIAPAPAKPAPVAPASDAPAPASLAPAPVSPAPAE